ncbi:Fe-S cluster assembly protein SufB [Candidatus Curtissbacteria bacterium]|nr:Fe-S cluster assembly protein SufB [Candidatus Curtissbacteria bacterium]
MANGLIVPNDYKYGFSKPENYVFKSQKGLDKSVVEQISGMKSEPEWMREFRLRSLAIFASKKMPTWGADLSTIDFDNIYYYIKPIDKQAKSWEELPKDIRDTYDAIGIPEAEKKFLAGVTTQYDSESVYHSFKKQWEDMGVIFLDMDSGLRKYPDLVKQYFGRSIPPADNKFASLNSAVWSGGSFVYVPPGVSVDIPLQAYFRINAANMGQFERTLIIVDEGAYVHYVEGCFIAGARVKTDQGEKLIEDIEVGDNVLTHKGRYRRVYNTMKRQYKGKIFSIKYYGDSDAVLKVTEEHPLFVCKREKKEYRNTYFSPEWIRADKVELGDYLVFPIQRKETEKEIVETDTIKTVPLNLEKPFIYNFKPNIDLQIPFGNGIHVTQKSLKLTLDPDFYRLVGYYLSEGHVDKDHYLTFTFNIKEKEYLKDVKSLLTLYFGKEVIEGKIRNNGQTITICSTLAARFFRREFGSTNRTKHISAWMLESPKSHLGELIKGLWRGDGSYDKKANLFRYNSVTRQLAYGFRDALLKIGVVASINLHKRVMPRQIMYTVIISRTSNVFFGQIVQKDVLNGRKEGSPFFMDENYIYLPIKSIKVEELNTSVYNFSVEEDESYVAEGVISHNCTAPVYTTDSLHAAVVEIFVKRGARCRYTTIQNWSSNVYNLVTKRAFVEEEGTMEWVDANIGCLTENAKLFTNPEGPVSIKDLKAGDWIYTTDLNTLKAAKSKVNAVVDQGVKPVFKVLTTNYREIEATANHPFLVLRKTSNIGLVTLRWEKLENLKVGDWIAIVNELPDDGKPYEINFSYDQHLLKHKPTIPNKTSEELMWLLGLYLGDGCMDRSFSGVVRRIYFAVPPNDHARKKLEKLLKFVFDIPFTPKGISLTVNSTALAKLFLDLGFSGTAKTKKIPNWIFSLSRREKLAFIEGYFDADGYLRKAIKKDGNQYGQIVFASANKNLLESLKLLMMSVGLDPLKITTYTKERKLYKGRLIEYTSHYLSMNIRGNLERIIEKKEFDPTLRFTRVRSIEPIGRLRVYDIEVDKTANFIANGIVVHNSKITMKYPSCYLVGRGARGEVLSLAYAGAGQHQDAGGKLMFLAPDTSGEIISKSVSAFGGRTSYRGLVKVIKNAERVKCNVRCDALILDEKSRSDTYPTMQVNEDNVRIGHEAAVSRIDAAQLFYLMSRGLTEMEATSLIVNGFIEPIVKELPLEYAVELNRLIQLEMIGAVG